MGNKHVVNRVGDKGEAEDINEQIRQKSKETKKPLDKTATGSRLVVKSGFAAISRKSGDRSSRTTLTKGMSKIFSRRSSASKASV